MPLGESRKSQRTTGQFPRSFAVRALQRASFYFSIKSSIENEPVPGFRFSGKGRNGR